MTGPDTLPDERPQRRREYSGAGSTLGVAALVVVVLGLGIWWFEVRGGDAGGATLPGGMGVVALPEALNTTGRPAVAELGRAAPNFRLPSLAEDAAAGPVTLTDYRGRWVVLNFWAAWCKPCRQETPELQALAERHPATVTVIGLNQQEDRKTAAKFASAFGVTYPIALDLDGSVSEAYRLGPGLPVTFLLSPDGVLVRAIAGRVTADALAALEREYLE